MKKLIYSLLLLTALPLFSHCTTEEKEIYDLPVAQRMNKALADYEKILSSSPSGWEMRYFPGALANYGGWHVLMKFEDGVVEAASEQHTTPEKSYYRLTGYNGPMLEFDTNNPVIHYFSEPASGVGDTGRGMEGDYCFTIREASAEKVVLTGLKSRRDYVLTPLPEGADWEARIKELNAVTSGELLQKGLMELWQGDKVLSVVKHQFHTLAFSPASDKVLPDGKTFSYLVEMPGKLVFPDTLQVAGRSVAELLPQGEGDASTLTIAGDPSLVFKDARPAAKLLGYLSSKGFLGTRTWAFRGAAGSEKVQQAWSTFSSVLKLKKLKNVSLTMSYRENAQSNISVLFSGGGASGQVVLFALESLTLDPQKNLVTIGAVAGMQTNVKDEGIVKAVVNAFQNNLAPLLTDGTFSVTYREKAEMKLGFIPVDVSTLTREGDADTVLEGVLF